MWRHTLKELKQKRSTPTVLATAPRRRGLSNVYGVSTTIKIRRVIIAFKLLVHDPRLGSLTTFAAFAAPIQKVEVATITL